MAKWRSSAAYRIAFTYSTAFALAILVLGAAVYFAADAEFRSQRDSAIAEESEELRDEVDSVQLRREIAERESDHPTAALGFALFDPAGRRVAGSLVTQRPAIGWSTITFIDPAEGPDAARALTVALRDGSRLVVAADSEMIETIDATILELFAGGFVAVLLVGIVGALLLGAYLRQRLERISGTAHAVIAGDLTRRVPVAARDDEFDEVGRALNTMLDRTAQLMENLRQVSSDVAHDLRTPLLRLRGQLEQVGTVEGAAERAIAQGDAVLALFTAILRIAEVESGGLVASFAPIDLSALVADVTADYLPVMIDSGHALGWSVAPDVWVRGHRELLAQAIGNLLDNVRVHTPACTSAHCTLAADGANAHLTVFDDGPGVRAADRQRILQRFARAEASRTLPGNGLGLSLVAAVATAHGGSTLVGEDDLSGLRLTLTLPRVLP